jgi:alkanesulfonate monooxygenase SsuD/methylene tetrahydromethanopterin reductase-like flavin-dependent oxidoreductase (luciferase family)
MPCCGPPQRRGVLLPNPHGHDLLFGTFITPVAQPAMHAVDLALVADRADLDLATFHDHPYPPTFHDTWTLLAYVASRTTHIHVSGNVLNLPLRQPAVLAVVPPVWIS